jgi:MFS family permease
MSARTASWLAWSLAGLCVAMFLASVVLHVLAHSSREATSAGDTLSELLVFGSFLAFPIVGALIASRHPNNPVGWICLAVGLFWTLIFLGDSVPGSGPYLLTIAALNQATWIPPVGLLGIYLILLFPDGKLPSRRWRPLAWLSGAVMVLATLGITFSPGPLEDHPGVRNPFGLEGIPPWVFTAGIFILLLLPLCMLASALSLVLRYRRSGNEEREQIKWIAFAASVVGLLYLITMVSSLTYSGPWGAAGTPWWLGLLQQASLASFAAIPIAVGFAVLKYRLYDVEIVINRTLVYVPLTATLVALYFGGIVVLQWAFVLLTGQQSTLAVVGSTLVIAALFNPLRRRIQSFIDRRFYRRKYDARKTLDAFSAKLRDETDLNALSNGLVGVVRETMQPVHVSLWLRPERSSEAKRLD